MMKEELEKRVHEFAVQVYKEGFEEGREDAEMDAKTRAEDAYNKGLEDAWECVRQIHGMYYQKLNEVFPDSTHDNIFIDYSASETMQKIKEYEERQKQDAKLCDRCKNSKLCELSYLKYVNTCSDFCPKTDATDMNDGSIKVGDEVRIKGSDPVRDDCDYGVCTRSLPNINTIYVMRRDGSSGEENKDEWYRTGRFFPQVAEVLKLLRGDKE